MRLHELLAYVAFVFVSATGLLPWNLFMNAREYFLFKLRNVSLVFDDDLRMSRDTGLTDLQKSYEGWLTVTSGVSCLLGSVLNFLSTDRLSNTVRVLAGHVAVLVALVPTVALTFIPTDSSQELFFWLSMFLAALASMGSMAFIGCGVLGLAARFPAKFMQAVMIGQAVAGIVSSELSILCQMVTPNALLNGRLFFVISIAWAVLSVSFYLYLAKSDSVALLRESAQPPLNDSSASARLLADSDEDVDDASEGLSLRSTYESEDGSFKTKAKLIANQTKLETVSVFAVLIGSLGAFPALSSLVLSTSSIPLWRRYFSAFACFLLFNTGDAIGRLVSQSVIISDVSAATWSFARLVFIPLLFFCNIAPRHHSITLFPSDIIFIFLMTVFAISNGFLYSNVIISATRKVDVELRELTGSLLGLHSVLAALIGSCLGLFLVSVV